MKLSGVYKFVGDRGGVDVGCVVRSERREVRKRVGVGMQKRRGRRLCYEVLLKMMVKVHQ